MDGSGHGNGTLPRDAEDEQPGGGRGPEALSSVSKALSLLEAMSRIGERTVGISELAEAAALPKSTTHRLLKTLEARGFVERAGCKYLMGSRFIELGEAVWRLEYDELRDCSITTMEWLFERTGATVHLGVLVGRQVLYVEKITGRGGCVIPSRVGGRMPATCTALGKAMLALSRETAVEAALCPPLPRRTAHSLSTSQGVVRELARIRADGVAYDREEARPGVFCSAAPISTLDRPIAGISIAGPSARFATGPYAGLVREAATRLTRGLAMLGPRESGG